MRWPFTVMVLAVVAAAGYALLRPTDPDRERAKRAMEELAPREVFAGVARVRACGDGRHGASERRCLLELGDATLRGEARATAEPRRLTVVIERPTAEREASPPPPPAEALRAIAERVARRLAGEELARAAARACDELGDCARGASRSVSAGGFELRVACEPGRRELTIGPR